MASSMIYIIYKDFEHAVFIFYGSRNGLDFDSYFFDLRPTG